MRGMRFAVAGVLAVGMVSLAQAQFGRGGGLPIQFMVTNKALQEELKVTEEQATKLKEWSTEFTKKSTEMYKEEGVEFTKGTKFDDAMRAKMAAASIKVNKEAYKQLGDVLKKDQITRMKQIQTQQMGVNAFTNADVVETLKLTDSQKTSVKGITGDFQKEFTEFLEVHKEFIAEGYPAWTAIGNAVLLSPNSVVEMRLMAAIGAGKKMRIERQAAQPTAPTSAPTQ